MTSIQSKRKMTQDKMEESAFDRLMYESGLTADGSFFDMDQYDQEAIMRFAELIVRECSLIAGLMEYADRKMIGAQILDTFGIEYE